MTDPNWEPVMKRARAIVTNRGGRTCHAAIIARELGIPAVVGCGDATEHAEGRHAGHRALLRRRHRLHLRRPARDRGHRGAARRDAVLPDQDHDERRQPAAGLRLRADAELRRRPGAARVHHQQQHRRAPEGDPRLPERRRRPEEGGGVGGARPCVAARVLRRQAGRGHRDHRRRVLAQAGDRAAVGLQEQRVPQADRRLALRARRREPDARLPRRVALHQRRLRRRLRDGVRGAQARAQRHGPDQRRDHGAFVRTAGPGRARDRACWPSTA